MRLRPTQTKHAASYIPSSILFPTSGSGHAGLCHSLRQRFLLFLLILNLLLIICRPASLDVGSSSSASSLPRFSAPLPLPPPHRRRPGDVDAVLRRGRGGGHRGRFRHPVHRRHSVGRRPLSRLGSTRNGNRRKPSFVQMPGTF